MFVNLNHEENWKVDGRNGQGRGGGAAAESERIFVRPGTALRLIEAYILRRAGSRLNTELVKSSARYDHKSAKFIPREMAGEVRAMDK